MAESCDDICGSEVSEDSIIILEDMSDEESENRDLEPMCKRKTEFTNYNILEKKRSEYKAVHKGNSHIGDEQTELTEKNSSRKSQADGATCNQEIKQEEKSDFSECSTMSRSFEAGGKDFKVKIENIENSTISSEIRLRTRDFQALQEPGRLGWLREVVYSKSIKHLVVQIVYIPPGGKAIKLGSKKAILTYLAKTRIPLSLENFSFSFRWLGLGGDYEVSRKSSQDNSQRKSYQQFFKYIEGSSPPSVSCNLCDGKVISYNGFSHHMTQYHLPDETCSKCHEEIPAITFKNHKAICNGTVDDQTVNQDLMSSYSQFFSPLPGSSPLCVACNLCDGKTVSYENFTKHMSTYHLPDEKCSKCDKDVSASIFRSHTRDCDGTGTEPTLPLSSPLNYSKFFTHLEDTSPPRVACNLCGGKTVSYEKFARHMRHFHLPDETCSKCLEEVSARIYSKHKKTCDGSGTTQTLPPPLRYSQFFTAVEGSFPLVVACKLCDVTLGVRSFGHHYKSFHKSEESQSNETTRSFEENPTGYLEEKVLNGKQGLGLEALNIHKERQENNFDFKVKIDKPEDHEERDLNTNYLELDTTDTEVLYVSFSSTSTSEIVGNSGTELDGMLEEAD